MLVCICSYQFLGEISQNLQLFFPLPISALYIYLFLGLDGRGCIGGCEMFQADAEVGKIILSIQNR